MTDAQQPFDMNALLEQAQQMSQHLVQQQAEAAATTFEGQAGGEAVVVEVTGAYEFTGITIKPEAVDPDDVDMLQDLVLAALNDAMNQIQVASGSAMELGGMDMGGLGLDKLLGGGAAE